MKAENKPSLKTLIKETYGQFLAEEKAKAEAEKERQKLIFDKSLELFKTQLNLVIPPHIQEELNIKFALTTEITHEYNQPHTGFFQASFVYCSVEFILAYHNLGGKEYWTLKTDRKFEENFPINALFPNLLIQLGRAEELDLNLLGADNEN
jgi:hypothetical protein